MSRLPIPALGAVQAAIEGRITGPLLRTRSGAGMERRTVHRYVAATAKAAGITRPIGPHDLRCTVGTVGLTQGIPLRDVQRLLRHACPGTTLGSYDITGEALERQASDQVAGFLAGWDGRSLSPSGPLWDRSDRSPHAFVIRQAATTRRS